METSNNPLAGGCQCGHIRYRINGDPLTLYACHCLHCPVAVVQCLWHVNVGEDIGIRIALRAAKFWTETAGDGSAKICAFCPECGSRIYPCAGRR